MNVDPQRLKKFLLEANLIQPEDYAMALKKSEETRQKVGDVLISENLITRDKLAKFEAYLLGIPFVDMEGMKIEPEILKIIPEPIARAHNIIAFRRNENNLEVAMLDPEDLRMIDFIKKTSPSLKILPRLTTAEGIKNALRRYQEAIDMEFGEIIKKEANIINPLPLHGDSDEEKRGLEKVAQELPVIKIIDILLNHAILQRASDVHIEPLEKEMVVRYRIDGMLRDIVFLPISAAAGIVARIKVLSDLKLDEHRLPQDGRFKIETDNFKYSIRVSILPVYNGEKVVMRLLAEDTKAATLEGTGLGGHALELVHSALNKPAGMILITGPTGSGKTTTLYAMMQILNTPDVNISTVEDPVEYRMPRVNQTQVNPKIGLTFSSGLRSLVRQDPDIIMVGEIRDTETSSLAINAALTGHLVLSTLHTTEAAGAIPRLIDMKAEPFLISSTVNIVIAQRLVRKFSGETEKYKLKDADLKNLAKYCDLHRIEMILKEEKLLKAGENLEDAVLYRPKLQKDSEGDGYSGRIGIFEVLPVNETIKELILKRASTKEIAMQAIKEGMRTMVDDGFVKAARGLTSLEEVLRVITE